MAKRLIQVLIALVGAFLIIALVFVADNDADRSPETPQEDREAIEKGEDKPAEKPEKEESQEQRTQELLAMIEQKAYRSTEGIELSAGSYVSILMRESGSAFYREFKEGAKDACAELNKNMGYSGGDKVRLNCNAPGESESVSAQSNLLDEELDLYPDVVAASITDAKACEVQFDLAMENGIYVVGFDASPAYTRVAATVETKNKKGAERLSAKLCKAMKQKGNDGGRILLFLHDNTSMNLKARKKACLAYIKDKYPEFEVVDSCHLSELESMREEISAYYASDGDPANDIEVAEIEEKDMIRYYLDRYPDVTGIFAADEKTALTLLDCIGEKPEMKDVCAVAFGSDERFLEYLERGSLSACVRENGYAMGYATAVACFRLAAGKGNADKIQIDYTLLEQE